MNIHNYEGQLKKVVKKIFSKGICKGCKKRKSKKNKKLKPSHCFCRLNEKDREDLKRFYPQMVAQPASAGRILKILYTLKTLSKMLGKPFTEANKNDIVNLTAAIESRDDWSDWTKRDSKIVLRKYYKFLRGGDEYPEEVKWIKIKDSTNRLLPEDILTEEEIKKIAENTTNSRDKAFVLALYEGGCRIGEFLTMKVKNLIFDEYGAVFRVS